MKNWRNVDCLLGLDPGNDMPIKKIPNQLSTCVVKAGPKQHLTPQDRDCDACIRISAEYYFLPQHVSHDLLTNERWAHLVQPLICHIRKLLFT